MKEFISVALRFQNHQLAVLDQQALPHQEVWVDCQSPMHMIALIQSLKVRGAPLIGIAAAMALAQYAEQGATLDEIHYAAQRLRSARPTAVNLMHCIDAQIAAINETGDPLSVVSVAESLFLEDVMLCQQIATHGYNVLNDGDRVLTHCNTGSLVTAGIGTALGIVMNAHQKNKTIHVFVDETRPLLQGARLTTWELARASVPYTLICDNMAGALMRAGLIQKIIVGADRIARNGDFANKIGTYSLAVLAEKHHIPFYVAAPYTTIDSQCYSGQEIAIEERTADEVRGFVSASNHLDWSTPNSPVFNPAFDVTPAELVTAFILDHGLFKPHDIERFVSNKKCLKPDAFYVGEEAGEDVSVE